jgi:hypothetical protein
LAVSVAIFVESFALGVTVWVLLTAVESLMLDDIEDSLVPQLTTIIPKPMAANKNFFINILFLMLLFKVQ